MTTRTFAIVVTGAMAAFLLAFIAGAESQRYRLWPATAWAKVRSHLRTPLPPPMLDRRPVACPTGAMVILVVGQSHGANYVAERFAGRPGVFNAFEGNCYRAHDPLLGAEGVKGNLWTVVGDDVVAARLAPAVVILNPSIGSSKLHQWIPQGSLNAYLGASIASLPKGLTISHVAVQIGEGDYQEGTSARDFRKGLGKLVKFLRAQGVAAPVFVARESLYCSPAKPDNPIARVQRTFRAQGVFPGPNMDALPFGRDDGCHLSGTGAREFAAQWVETFFPDAPAKD